MNWIYSTHNVQQLHTNMITYKHDTIKFYIPVNKLLKLYQTGVEGKCKKFRNWYSCISQYIMYIYSSQNIVSESLLNALPIRVWFINKPLVRLGAIVTQSVNKNTEIVTKWKLAHVSNRSCHRFRGRIQLRMNGLQIKLSTNFTLINGRKSIQFIVVFHANRWIWTWSGNRNFQNSWKTAENFE